MMRVPAEPVSFEDMVESWPSIRQSLASNFDDCGLSAYFSMRYANGWSTHPQARGTIFHRTAAEILRTMQAQQADTIPRAEALEILLEQCHQRNVPAEDIVRVPLRQMPELRMAVDKFAKDNKFSTDKIVDIERKLTAEISYADHNGELRTRTITGTLDCLLFEPPDGAIVLDWKDTWALPPMPKESEARGYDDEELKGLSYHGYFQQRWYAYLVLRNYPRIERVTLREFYHRKTIARKASVHRHQMQTIEQEIAIIVSSMDAALMAGPPNLKPDADGQVDMDSLGHWKPAPGKHCSFCSKPTACPIEADVRSSQGGGSTMEQMKVWAARYLRADRIRLMAIEAIKGGIDEGLPEPDVAWSKGRGKLGWMKTSNGRKFGFYVPDESDRGGHADLDVQLVDAMKSSTARAREERGVTQKKKREPKGGA